MAKVSTDSGAALSSPSDPWSAPLVLHRLVLRWYGLHGRTLPWRGSTDPYLILVSELMLQQTQVARVLDHLPRWLEHFPDVRSLARASRRDVLLAWSGMGYNRRALYLHDAAKAIIEVHAGVIPSDPAVLRTLPGIGRYTSHAVACFGYRQRLPVVDVNIRRLLSRLGKNMQYENRMIAENDAWRLAADLLPPRAYYNWNQALMDIGAMVCTARKPDCRHCPLTALCPSAHNLRPEVKYGTSAAAHDDSRTPAEAVRETPRRIYRGRLVEFLRTKEGHHATGAELHRILFDSNDEAERARLLIILQTLERDGMISIECKGQTVHELPAFGRPLRELLITLAE